MRFLALVLLRGSAPLPSEVLANIPDRAHWHFKLGRQLLVPPATLVHPANQFDLVIRACGLRVILPAAYFRAKGCKHLESSSHAQLHFHLNENGVEQ